MATKSKKPTKEELEEEVISLALTVKYLLDDCKYLLNNNGSDERKENIKTYVESLEQFFGERKQ